MATSTRLRGSLTDAITLEEIFFTYEPRTRTKDKPKYGRQAVVGQRLKNTFWVGSGDSEIDLDCYAQGIDSDGPKMGADDLIAALKSLTVPQKDTRTPHPVYLNIGFTYLGRQYVVDDVDVQYLVFEYDDQMRTQDARIRLKLIEIPVVKGRL